MTCPICGGDTEVTHTLNNIDHVTRYRRCVDCKFTFRTIETDDLPTVHKKGKTANVESK